jgi:preprotein translocase subunit SecY
MQYAKRVVGRRVLGGASQYLPLKVNAAGVIPVIFASSMLGLPKMVPGLGWLSGILKPGEPLYCALFAATVIFFCYFYVSIVFNPREAADNLRKAGGAIPGLRPGFETTRYLDAILSRLTLMGGVYLAALCLIPDLLLTGIKLQHLPWVGSWMDAHMARILLDGLNVNFYFGGTSLLIVVGVALDLVNQVEAQLIMRHYEQYSPRGKRRTLRRKTA